MGDRELLELAARAADLTDVLAMPYREDCGLGGWNPLTDDGDALRLAVKLRLQVTPGTYNKDEFTAYNSERHAEAHEHWSVTQDEKAATRRAITRAAAAIAQEMTDAQW